MTPAVRAAVGRPADDLEPLYALRLLQEERDAVAAWALSYPDHDHERFGLKAAWVEIEPASAGRSLWEVAVERSELDAIVAEFAEQDGPVARRIEAAVLTAYLRGAVS